MTVALAPSRSSVSAGIGFACLGFALYTCMDTAVKWLSAGYPLYQVIFFNAAFGLVPMLAYAQLTGGFGQLKTRRSWLHGVRAALALIGSFTCFHAYSVMPIADVYAILFCAPLLITALSVPILGESVGWRRWSAVGVGFIGVMVMLRPGAGMANPAILGALFSAVANALGFLLLRRFIATENRITFGFYASAATAIATGLMILVFGGVMPALNDLLPIAIGGMLGGSAYLFVTNAYRQAPAAVVAPFQYTQMIWGVLSGYLLWQDVPDTTMLIGCAIVIASGLYILHRETVRQAPVAQGATPAGTVASAASPIKTT
ncbi:drug/metabolite transporter (DMT)-like permease [Inquilinus ginsengisoli]|uniref:Drug/metabolite transporter (DMT)-like permease n=1 Tax=Inquilinus ginsengisoli TaxID=363840 RepID=A0ABU1JYF4_9PROT|nr:DMT family transporter [Inquilinus ginsengisoli]MDR6292579.1 drug/metabolite transporter (DMT)-like permease [Inquilinus ginsengisoli]